VTKKRIFVMGLIMSLLTMGLLTSCAPKEAELGTEDNPIILSFVPSGDTRISSKALMK